jgi:dolichol-phosphate mannosyltransferase
MLKLSIVIPAYNEEKNVGRTLEALTTAVEEHSIPYEIIVVNDNSTDQTAQVVSAHADRNSCIRLVDRTPPGGFGRAVRSGIEQVRGDVVVICMADLSDCPNDVVAYYRKICEGYDCVFGSRFIQGGSTENYPIVKLVVNRIVNTMIRLLFWTRFNDLTNAFKAYRTDVIRECGPYRSSHFNITLELSLSALVRQYRICQIPIRWYGRTWGASSLKLREMGRRYLCTVLMFYFQRILIKDDLVTEQLAGTNRGKPASDPVPEASEINQQRTVLSTAGSPARQKELLQTDSYRLSFNGSGSLSAQCPAGEPWTCTTGCGSYALQVAFLRACS